MRTTEINSPLSIGIVLFPGITQLDFTGPYEVFIRFPEINIYLLSPSLEPIKSDGGLTFLPDTTFAQAPNVDVLFVPGGPGINERLEDKAFLEFLKSQGEQARYVTSVCTGALLLAAAGLLEGYRATTHWLSLDLLAMFGVETVKQRIVIDRNRITGGGVTAGIDFGLAIAAELFGETLAQEIQLKIEYNPQPPFNSGSPDTAPADVLERVEEASRDMQETRREIIERVISGQSTSDTSGKLR